MRLESSQTAGSKIAFVVGWIISAIPILMMGVGGVVFAVLNPEMVRKSIVDHGYSPNQLYLIVSLEVGSAIIYAIPQTAVLGAILLTGYLGGAVATHVRVGEPAWIGPVIFGVFVWLGIFLRDRRLRQLLPFRR